ncbi:uncharacterized protein LOC129951502 [Eupeodes corollae]|uniref:uncharacterized protein LOC129951502 n=1 Tax=Eupeodes corollae TaxID=290404 RepID=UPI0024934CB6|nr:uncharacterized protein LOC129951502 [Eupeodes corollae]XP_055919666.1 uncharacterized protein LOC129951502 [Eupeodes corollae]
MLTTHHLHSHHHHAPTTLELEKITNLSTLIVEINSQVALFRDMLIHVGQSKDCPELREKIRKLRRSCIEACKHTVQIIMPQVKSAVADGILTDNPHLVLLFYLSQLFLRELVKSYRLIQVVPMDMSGYYENRAGPSNLGNVISQILLCKQITPDFNQEELCSITKDSQEIAMLLAEMQEYMPQHETYLERNAALSNDANGPWPAKRRRNSIYKNMGLLCCVSRPNYL